MLVETYMRSLSDTLASSMLELCSVGPTVHSSSSCSGSQHVDVISSCRHLPKRTLRRLRISGGGLQMRDETGRRAGGFPYSKEADPQIIIRTGNTRNKRPLQRRYGCRVSADVTAVVRSSPARDGSLFFLPLLRRVVYGTPILDLHLEKKLRPTFLPRGDILVARGRATGTCTSNFRK
jgi:hypothetical protein